MMRCMRIPRFLWLSSCAATVVFLSACDQPKTAVDNTYFDESLGWNFPIPPDWEERGEIEREAVRSKGRKLMEESLGAEVVGIGGPVLYLKFDDGNRFTSDVETYDAASEGPYEDIQRAAFQALRQALGQALESKNIVLRHREDKLQIDGVPFAVMTMEMLSHDEKTVIATSVTFDGLIRGSSFSMSYTCRSKPRCEEIHSAIIRSKFDRD